MARTIEAPIGQIETEDSVLEKATRNIRVQRVRAPGSAARATGRAIQSHEARAWTSGGNVD